MKHLMKSWPFGTQGEFDKIEEEYAELQDAYAQKDKNFQIVECSDLVYAVGRYSRKHLKVPLIALLFLAWARRFYKRFIR